MVPTTLAGTPRVGVSSVRSTRTHQGPHRGAVLGTIEDMTLGMIGGVQV